MKTKIQLLEELEERISGLINGGTETLQLPVQTIVFSIALGMLDFAIPEELKTNGITPGMMEVRSSLIRFVELIDSEEIPDDYPERLDHFEKQNKECGFE